MYVHVTMQCLSFQAGVDFVRLGSAARIHPDIVPFTPAQSLQGVTSVQQLEYFYQSKVRLLILPTALVRSSHLPATQPLHPAFALTTYTHTDTHTPCTCTQPLHPAFPSLPTCTHTLTPYSAHSDTHTCVFLSLSWLVCLSVF